MLGLLTHKTEVECQLKNTLSPLPPDPRQNRILAALPEVDYMRVLPDLKLVPMPLGWTMSGSGDHVKFLHYDIRNGLADLCAGGRIVQPDRTNR